ncbi:putative bifunctional diguanylate cyclase/phosphodiesterase [Methyloversatilis sp.]|uniref:putative bifunctional diguanylate cyclase/phosphodiesterase n=1 Tax=Methyloversatilis sp. TaxID=2569862 RepID=UPI0035B47181
MMNIGLKWKIAAWCAALLLVTQVGGLLLFGQIGRSSAMDDAALELKTGDRVFARLLDERTTRLTQAARVLAADYGFRESLLSGDRETIASALSNHGGRINADLMLLLALDESVVAGAPFDPGRASPRLHALIEAARQDQGTGGFAVIQDGLYQLVVVPVMAPVPVAWVVMGFAVDRRLANDLKEVTGLEVSFVRRPGDAPWRLVSSTLNEPVQSRLLHLLSAGGVAGGEAISLEGRDYVSRLHEIDAGGGEEVGAVLQLSLERALAPWERLYRDWSGLSLIGIALALVASAFMGRSIASPVVRLADFARRVEAGEYGAPPQLSRGDEIGTLTDAFAHMAGAIASRETRITELAYYDALTGLPNRACFAERLDEYARNAVAEGSDLAIVSLDVDRFKMVNDTLGHEFGDLLLREVARRLRETLRDVRDQVARLGGDEFAVMLPGADAHKALGVAHRIGEALNRPMDLDGRMVDVSASMGVAACPQHGRDAQALIRQADVAMYLAKRQNTMAEVYDPRHHDQSVERLSLLSELQTAVERDELVLHYQPKVATACDPVHHVEALVRWIHPTRGFVPPFEFIPFAEQTGCIKAITLWVMNAAIRQCGEWLRKGLEVNVSLNLSARDLLNPDLPALFSGMLDAHACPARLITLEITESAVLDDPLRALNNLQRLRETGCALSIDDYGTGYSSLSYLRQMPVSEMKIDRSFVMHLLDNPNDEIIVRSTIELAHNMGLKVTAEGVESEAVLQRLRELGCDLVQGYLISKPIPADSLEQWFAESRWAQRDPGSTADRKPEATQPPRSAGRVVAL